MHMEQRKRGERVAIDLDVVVSCSRVGLFRGHAHDANMGGMYISSGTVSMPLEASLVVTFVCPDNTEQQCVNAKAVVIHQSMKGFGLSFEALDADCERALTTLIAN